MFNDHFQKYEVLLLKDQLDQKEKLIKELLSEKKSISEEDFLSIKKENEELVKLLSTNKDKDTEFTIKNLCNQNAQLRKKLYDAEKKKN